jgi:hypothetical protein
MQSWREDRSRPFHFLSRWEVTFHLKVQPGKIASKSLAGLDSGNADSLTVAASAGQFKESLKVLGWNSLLWWS